MIVPAQYIVDTVDLTSEDALLPLFECVVNSIISLMQVQQEHKEIQIKIKRGEPPIQMNFNGAKTINSITISDNGLGFNEKNFKSYETPFSKVNKAFGCKGIGRFTVMAAFRDIKINSTFFENGQWFTREFHCDAEKEVSSMTLKPAQKERPLTSVILTDCFNSVIKDQTAMTLHDIAVDIMSHCLIYYLSGHMPIIRLYDIDANESEVINDLYANVSKEKERTFTAGPHQFQAYITAVPKENNRKHHYVYYCANSRVVGKPRSLGRVNSSFSYPIYQSGKPVFLDIYLTGDYLNDKNFKSRNGFSIPLEKDLDLFDNDTTVSFDEIEKALVAILEDEYREHMTLTSEKSVRELQQYIDDKAPRFRSLRSKPELLKAIPPNLSDDKKEEHLYKITYQSRKAVENKIKDFIDRRQISEENLQAIVQDIRDKTAYDSDSLADYMMRRKAVIELFDKFLEADNEGKYKLEEDIHNIIFPRGLTSDDISYEMHNLWLLDERFLTYKFIASDKSITSISQKKSSKEPDVICLAEHPQMFNNPMSFGDKNSGELNSLVIFEFKRPGEIAHQKNKTDYRWEFSELIQPYFDDFLYAANKKNYKGKQVVVRKETPKFGFIILDVLPKQLEDYNQDKGWDRTPFGTYYKMESRINLHIEVMTFSTLLTFARERHLPFFNKLFTS